MPTITPCLWFDGQAEEAATFYTSLLPDSRIDQVHRAPGNYPSGKAGDVLTGRTIYYVMPKVKSIKIDGVSFNVDHAKSLGKEAWSNSPELQHHFQHLPESQRKQALSDLFEKVVADPAGAKVIPASPVATSAIPTK